MNHKLGLVEALCGFQFMLKHLDGRQIVVKYPAGKVIEPAAVRVVRGEGMPQYRNPFEKGDLYVKFDVQFPENNWISPEKLVVRYYLFNCSLSSFSILWLITVCRNTYSEQL
ncbi:dnaJ homolog subfamily A member 2-like [Notothenia coriiceps]|uniref:DnaJ homolog subfamily A member 2-like n=1 Tax=Notothenia coriiceps TaxID=8208 RepID=A0A6I9PPJ5_9TELE|nr:PREDICTED: dnaJ homolog subfamily A member 2-like [Notothenia coriiceps]